MTKPVFLFLNPHVVNSNIREEVLELLNDDEKEIFYESSVNDNSMKNNANVNYIMIPLNDDELFKIKLAFDNWDTMVYKLDGTGSGIGLFSTIRSCAGYTIMSRFPQAYPMTLDMIKEYSARFLS